MTPTDLDTQPRRQRRRSRVTGTRLTRAVVAAIATAAVVAGGAFVATAPAQAAGQGAGFGVWGSGVGTGWEGAFVAPDGTDGYCIDPGLGNPTNPTTDLGIQSNVTSVGNPNAQISSDDLARISYLVKTHGQTSDNVTASAVSFAVKAIANPAGMYNSHGYPASSPRTIASFVNWVLNSAASGAQRAAVAATAQQFYDEAQAITASAGQNGNAGNPNSIVALDPTNPQSGTVTINFNGADSNATWTDTLVNAVWASTGTPTMTGTVGSNQTVTEQIIPKLTQVGQKVTDEGSVTAPGQPGGFAGDIRVFFTTQGTQKLAGAGDQTVGSPDTVPFGDPAGLPTSFSPTASTQSAAKYYTEGTKPVDNVKPGLGGTQATSWPIDANGNYVKVTIDGTLYGPLATKPVQGATVPAGTPVAGHGQVTVGGGTTDPSTQTVQITSDTATGAAPASSGYYVWVEGIKGSEQSAATQQWLKGGSSYDYTTDYGIADESFLAPPAVTTSTAAASTGVTTPLNGTNVPTQGLGLPVKDNISVTGTVDGSAGMYVIDRHYTFANTVGPDGHVIVPAAADLVTDASTLDYTSPQIPVTKAGDYSASFNSSKVGSGTWIETLYAADGTVLSTGSSKNYAEWTAVQQLVVTTQAKANSNGTATDTATIWGTVPAGAQLASVLYNQTGSAASTTDQSVATAGPVGLNQGLVNGVVVTLPAVNYPKSMKVGYFVEAVYDLEGNLIVQNARGVASETINVGNGGNAAAAGAVQALPKVAG